MQEASTSSTSDSEDQTGVPSRKALSSKTTTGGGASLSRITEVWKEIDLEGKRSQLDAQAAEITDNKDARLLSRKKLTEQTKNFRKQNDEEKVKSVGSLLKLYQDEIDQLTKRCKFSESSFLSLYKLLADAPDPVSGLTAMNDQLASNSRVTELELENKKYRTELEEFRKDFQEIQNQEVTIRHLEDKLSEYENKAAMMVEERVKEQEERIKAENQKLSEALSEKEQELRRQLFNSNEESAQLRHTLEVTQTELLYLRTRHDERQTGRQSEIEMLTDELDRARAKILALEREREKNSDNLELRNVQSNMYTSLLTSTDLELELAQKDIEISHLKEHIQKLEFQINSDSALFTNDVAALRSQLQEERSKVSLLTSELQAMPTREEHTELKKQVDVLKSTLEYGTSDSEIDSVENILKTKNRKLETEFMKLKATLAETTSQLSNSAERITQLEKAETDYKNTIARLEEDISKGYNNKPAELFSTDTQKVSKAADESAVLQIVCNQRDRFKARTLDLESDNKNLHQRLEIKDKEIRSLREDNIKLYEKIKYLQSYGSRTKNTPDIEANKLDDDVDTKYSKLYEDSVNPFVLFNRKEKYRRYKELNAAEKVILNTGRFFLSTKASRVFLFVYSVLLHALVFLAVYKLAHATTCLKD